MTAEKILAKFERTCDAWRSALDRRTEDCFARERDGWTLGQVCDHVTRASWLFLDAAEDIASGAGKLRRGGLMPFIAFRIFGSLPPFRFKVPPDLPESFRRIATPEPLTRGESIERFVGVATRTRKMRATVHGAPPTLRSRHPAAGWLNASDWYQLSEMHMRHHLRQLARIEKELGEPPA